MPMAYSIAIATAANSATSGTPNTEVGVFFVKPGSTRTVSFYAIDVIGKGAGLTSLSGIGFRFRRYGTASTSGTAITPTPKDAGMQAAVATAASAPTVGSTITHRAIFGCSATGPGGWWAKNPDDMEVVPAGNAASLDLISVSGTASLNFEFSGAFQE